MPVTTKNSELKANIVQRKIGLLKSNLNYQVRVGEDSKMSYSSEFPYVSKSKSEQMQV